MKIAERVIGKRSRYWLIALIFIGVCFLSGLPAVQGGVHAQQPTVAIPTVTSSPVGAYIIVNTENDQINVRSGPDVAYPIVGVLQMNQQAPAIGRSSGGGWIMIAYPGVPGGNAWVYAPLVTLYGTVPIVEPPPTPTPATTPTIDPTLAAQFIVEIPPTRLPTFTEPPPLAIPTFTSPEEATSGRVLPIGLVIAVVGIVGLFGLMISFFRGR
jgi:uncharacterized protein YraI